MTPPSRGFSRCGNRDRVAQMTVTSTTYRSVYNGNGSTTSFSAGFLVYDADHVNVVHVDAGFR
jgi:hypothetical protein